MPDPQPSTEEADDWAVLEHLVDTNEQRPWSVDELIRACGDRVATLDAIDRLYRAGLSHRTADGFIFATRAAVRFQQIRE
jgi:hypothetical protein